jgi:hypothetical protein
LSKEALDRVALQRVKTIANEDEIDADIASTDTMLLVMKEMQGSTDAIRAKAAQTQKELDTLKGSKQNQTTEPEPSPADNPLAKEFAEMKALLEGVTAEIAENKKKARTEAIMTEVHAKMKTLGCTNDYIRKTTLQGIEISDSDTADSIAEKYKSVYDENCKAAFGNGYVPPKGNNQGGKDEIDYSAMIEGLMASGAIPNKK